MDLIFSSDNTLRIQFEESAITLYKLLVAFLRAGKIQEATLLAEKCGCYSLAALVDSRNSLNELDLSSRNENNPDFGFSDARLAMKVVARSILGNVSYFCWCL